MSHVPAPAHRLPASSSLPLIVRLSPSTATRRAHTPSPPPDTLHSETKRLRCTSSPRESIPTAKIIRLDPQTSAEGAMTMAMSSARPVSDPSQPSKGRASPPSLPEAAVKQPREPDDIKQKPMAGEATASSSISSRRDSSISSKSALQASHRPSSPPTTISSKTAISTDSATPLSPSLSSPNTSSSRSTTTSSWPKSQSCKLSLKQRSKSYWCGEQKTKRALRCPEQITSFSYDEQRRLFHDDRSLKFFHVPPPKVDLGRGIENFIERDPSRNEHLDSLLYSLMDLAARSEDPESDLPRRSADVITWRGMATKIFSALYEEQNSFSMNLMLVNDTLYIEEWTSPDAKAAKAKENTNERLRRFGYYGYGFESWCTHSRDVSRGERVEFDYSRDDPWDGDVNTNVQWCSVVRTKLGDLSMILGGEVDCVDVQPEGPTRSAPSPSGSTPSTSAAPVLVELKTTAMLRRAEDEVRFEKKMLRFFLQSWLLGVGRVLVGFRDPQGTLHTTHTFKTVEMPALVKGKAHGWDRGGCCNVAWSILNFAREKIRERIREEEEQKERQEDDALPTTWNGTMPTSTTGIGARADIHRIPYPTAVPPVFRLEFHPPFNEVRLTRLTMEEVEEIKGADASRVGFLPRDYYDFAMRSHKS